MQLISGVGGLPQSTGVTTATIGNFDGMHKGHRLLVSKVTNRAKELKIPSVVMTFDPHPVKILYPERQVPSIFSLNDRIEVLKTLGVDFVVVEPFSRELSERTPEFFFQTLLINALKVKELFVGHDFSFGKNRTGTLTVLEKLCQSASVNLTVVPAVQVQGVTVSSSKVREAVERGQVNEANQFLDRYFYLDGIVEKGDGRGHSIGFPTANLSTLAELIPKRGVYFTQTTVNEKTFRSLTNIGVNPTFNKSENISLRIETHILDFNEDIYGKAIMIEFIEFIRDEKKFNSVDELVSEIKKDVLKVEKMKWKRDLK